MGGQTELTRVSFDECIFTIAQSDGSYRFLRTRDALAANSFDIVDLAFSGCTFRSFNPTTHPTALMSHQGTGFIDVDGCQGFKLDRTNSFWNVPKQLSEIVVDIPLTGASTYAIDFTGKTPFDVNVNRFHGPFITNANVLSPMPYGYVQRTGGKAATVHITNRPATGTARVIASVNVGDM